MYALPAEILHEIASHDVYREMLTLPSFARSLTISVRFDYMIAMGYGIAITHDKIAWTKNGMHHRRDGPAVERANGDKEWWIDGKCHRENGPAVEYTDGYKEWWIDGKLHREDGPAIEHTNGYKEWYVNGERHRIGGPAVEWSDGSWWVNGIRVVPQI